VAELDVVKVDAFTEDLYSGNPTWVVFDPDALDDVQMQRIAFELGGPSTAFCLRSKKADVRLRYFSPFLEDPISGHATIGALGALLERGVFGGSAAGKHRLETAIGVLPFHIDTSRDGPKRVWMTQRKPMFANVAEFKESASALGIGAESLFHEEFPLTRASTGLPCLLVPVRSAEILGRIEPRQNEINELAEELEISAVVAYTWDVLDAGSTVQIRCLLPGPVVAEDIASGMPAGALGAYLAENDLIPRDSCDRIVIEQGHWLGRPSRINVRLEKRGSAISRVDVGGSVRISVRGRISID